MYGSGTQIEFNQILIKFNKFKFKFTVQWLNLEQNSFYINLIRAIVFKHGAAEEHNGSGTWKFNQTVQGLFFYKFNLLT